MPTYRTGSGMSSGLELLCQIVGSWRKYEEAVAGTSETEIENRATGTPDRQMQTCITTRKRNLVHGDKSNR